MFDDESYEEKIKRYGGMAEFLASEEFAKVWPEKFERQLKILNSKLLQECILAAMLGQKSQLLNNASCVVDIFVRLLEAKAVLPEALIQATQDSYDTARNSDEEIKSALNKVKEAFL